MANYSLPHVTLLPKELTALSKLIQLSFAAFEAGGYPIYYECFLSSLIQVIQLGSAAVMHAAPKVSINEYSKEMDQLSGFLKEAKLAVMASNAEVRRT